MKDEALFFKACFDWNVAWSDLQPLARRFLARDKEKALGVMTKIAIAAIRKKEPVLPALKAALEAQPPVLIGVEGSDPEPRKGRKA